jgi:hypothetical protein
MKSNCWDITQCGREEGGKLSAQLGVCAASVNHFYNGTNGGVNAGRCCWRVCGTMFGGDGRCQMLKHIDSCQDCLVYKTVLTEEGRCLRL